MPPRTKKHIHIIDGSTAKTFDKRSTRVIPKPCTWWLVECCCRVCLPCIRLLLLVVKLLAMLKLLECVAELLALLVLVLLLRWLLTNELLV